MSTMTQTANRMHPLVAVAAISVTVVSLLGIAALTGILPSSHGSVADAHPQVSEAIVQPVLPASSPKTVAADSSMRKPAARRTSGNNQNYAPPPNSQLAQNDAAQTQSPTQMQSPAQGAPAPVQPKPAAAPHNSAVGIGVGALIGGILGSQVGGGNGKTLATIAGAVGGGYVGNEVAKRNQ